MMSLSQHVVLIGVVVLTGVLVVSSISHTVDELRDSVDASTRRVDGARSDLALAIKQHRESTRAHCRVVREEDTRLWSALPDEPDA